jgi:hypothetical protein
LEADMSCASIESLDGSQVALAGESKRSVGCWLREIVARPLSALVKMTYRSSRFWSVYLG